MANINNLLNEGQRVRAVGENIKPRSCCIELAMARSIQRDTGLVFSRADRTIILIIIII